MSCHDLFLFLFLTYGGISYLCPQLGSTDLSLKALTQLSLSLKEQNLVTTEDFEKR